MLDLAERNKARIQARNVEFVESHITKMPLEPGMANIVMSNCVINLVPEVEKQLVFNEMFRILKAGGRLSISDTLAKKSIPENLQRSMSAYVGCIAGASLISQYESYLKTAGFSSTNKSLSDRSDFAFSSRALTGLIEFLIEDTKSGLNVYIDTMPDGATRRETAGKSSCPPKRERADPVERNDCQGCCIPPETPTEDGELVKLRTDLAGIDINEWVGKLIRTLC